MSGGPQSIRGQAPAPAIPLTATQETLSALRPGDSVPGRVTEQLPQGAVRISTPEGPVEVRPSQPLPVGTEVRLQVQNDSGGVPRVSISVPSSQANTPDAPQVNQPIPSAVAPPRPDLPQQATLAQSLPPTAQPAATPATVVAQVNETLTDLAAPTRVAPLPVDQATQAAQAVRQVVGQAVLAAAGTQDSLAPLFANLAEVADSNVQLPRNVQNAVSTLLNLRTPLDATITADDIEAALNRTGLFTPVATTAEAAPEAPPQNVQTALRLLGLPQSVAALPQGQIQEALTNLALSALDTGTNPQAAGLLAGAVNAGALPGAAQTRIVPQVDIQAVKAIAQLFGVTFPPHNNITFKDLQTVLQDLARDQNRQGNPGGQLNVKTALTDLRQSLTGWLGGGQQAEPGEHHTPPPRGDAWLAAQHPEEPSISADLSPRTIGEKLLKQTEAALARQGLLQFGSSPDSGDVLPHRPGAGQPQWMFEVPFAMGQQTAVVPFQITRDGKGKGSRGDSARGWQVRFSLDVDPIGPVHALVTLQGDAASVRLWAEQRDTAQTLRQNLPDLREALSDANFEIGDVNCGLGAPVEQEERPAGYFVDQTS